MPAPNVTPKANGSSGGWLAIFTVLSRGDGDGAPRRSHGCDLIDPPRPAVPFAGAGSFRTALSPSGPPARSLDGGPWASNPCARGAPQQIKNDLLMGDFLTADRQLTFQQGETLEKPCKCWGKRTGAGGRD